MSLFNGLTRLGATLCLCSTFASSQALADEPDWNCSSSGESTTLRRFWVTNVGLSNHWQFLDHFNATNAWSYELDADDRSEIRIAKPRAPGANNTRHLIVLLAGQQGTDEYSNGSPQALTGQQNNYENGG